MANRIGVVLCGCGHIDGSEIQEAVSVLIALDRHGVKPLCMAPNIPQAEAVNFLTRKPIAPRNCLEEAARIARGSIVDLAQVDAGALDALILPGGFGAAKNLCTFAKEGVKMTVYEPLAKLILSVHAAKKPMGFACIAPVIAAKVLGEAGCNPKLTLGADDSMTQTLKQLKATHVNVEPAEVCIDEINKIVSTPCYMNNVGPWIVFQGAGKMVDEVIRLMGK